MASLRIAPYIIYGFSWKTIGTHFSLCSLDVASLLKTVTLLPKSASSTVCITLA